MSTHRLPPPRIERYEILYSLGAGGMGSVWMARGVRDPEKFFVVKTLLAEHADNKDFREMFFDEARIASSIDHPNVARIFDLGDEDRTPYLVMEVVDGESLQSIYRALKNRDTLIAPPIALRIIADVCTGLHAAHELRDLSGQLRDVVHRDISPHNILVGIDGVSKVIDFGIAKARDRAAETTTTGALKGKLRYMSPEQGHGKSIDRRADIWATGAVLYLLLSGKSAIDGPNDAAILGKLLFGGSPEPLADSIPQAVRAVVNRALERDLDLRYPTAEAMREDIENALREMGESVSASDVAGFMEDNFHDSAVKRHSALAAARSGPTSSSSNLTTVAMSQTISASTADETTKVTGRRNRGTTDSASMRDVRFALGSFLAHADGARLIALVAFATIIAGSAALIVWKWKSPDTDSSSPAASIASSEASPIPVIPPEDSADFRAYETPTPPPQPNAPAKPVHSGPLVANPLERAMEVPP